MMIIYCLLPAFVVVFTAEVVCSGVIVRFVVAIVSAGIVVVVVITDAATDNVNTLKNMLICLVRIDIYYDKITYICHVSMKYNISQFDFLK